MWLSGTVPDRWKKACTILIHEKDDPNLPENFRPIILQSVPLKVFTSSLRNAMLSYLLANNFVEHNIQKGFTPHISGTFEHTAQMAYIINQARIRQRSLIITLLDLKNVFGEVHHHLIKSVLGYNHIPDHIQLIIKSLYTNFKTSKKLLPNPSSILPKLIINSFLIPVIEIGKSFCYLGRYFDHKMSDDKHKLELVSLLTSQMKEIDLKPLHPKNKILLYSRYVLPKLACHRTITSISKTCITENLDSTFVQYIRKWLKLPISGTLSNVCLTSNKSGLNIIPLSTKFIQCQTTIRATLKSSPNESITHLWKLTKNHTHIQYDQYSVTKEVIRSFRDNQENKLTNQLTSEGSFFTSTSRFSLPQGNTIWSTCQFKLPKNIFNFTIRYISNSLPTHGNLQKWGLTSSSE